ncbi:hypothetical protein QNH20_12895 [Neobacillus sp. WH10]|uniref:imm11 family protein n=1 Tax=Neobacillus sp. WH10 TaxID=3047873 RepID=UPI0024C1F59F|nr:DUF1629 domain-containing protein [Neobacillus sp. WH10]WHY79978.1 hypothetical protein QNH20_12895 [Neobacillus sp. WH10]
MKIWQLSCQCEKYEILSFMNDEDSDLFRENFRGVPMKETWIPIQVGTYKEGNESDYPDGLLSPPVFSEKAVHVLGGLLQGKAELLPLYSTKYKKYYAINVVNVLDCIDGENSEVKRYRTGSIMKYKKYAFVQQAIKGQDIFKIVDHEEKKIKKTSVFVSDLFRNKVLNSGLKGFDFIEVWDFEKAATGEEEGLNPYLVDTSFGTTYTFEEASDLVMNKNKTIACDKWAMRMDENKELQVGQLQEDGSYLWLNPIYYPPIFLRMKWKVL